ncbi:unnamed protein product [Linum trigynum]|uniref:Trehalase n=1 Tax=Linum trigynum TaxID=586398 RepID=A0AAV2DJT4_9ROSI
MARNIILLTFLLLSSSLLLSSRASTMGVLQSGTVIPTTPLVEFLVRVQETAFQTLGGEKGFDPKWYVDVSLKFNLSHTQKVFDGLPRKADGVVPVQEFRRFVAEQFDDAGSDLVAHEPVDFVAEPDGFLPMVLNPKVRAWALEVHSLWKNLSRKVSDHVHKYPELHTLLPLPEPVVIPGSRFREVYYWDSYWVIRGLLASKMYDTAKSIVINLIYLLDTYGHVLNGARAYYTNRSQPPLLSSMVYEIYNRTGDVEFAQKALPALIKEHKFWTSGEHNVAVLDAKNTNHSLSRYYAMWNEPRPESAIFDKESAANISDASKKQQFYREVASAAETGWDFSTRWMGNNSDFTTMSTTSILPVDLNVYLLKVELDITSLARATGEETIAKSFSELSEARQEAIRCVLWNAEKGQWFDYRLYDGDDDDSSHPHTWKGSNQNQNAFASNFVPLWIDLFHSDTTLVEQVTQSLEGSGLVRAAGIATSSEKSGQQWDFPNGWAPLQHMISEGLGRSGSHKARSFAEEIATRWINSNYGAYNKTSSMHEKLDVEACGDFGGGGEYVPQTGFGWSNGVVLALLEEFGWPHDKNFGC